MRQKTLVLFDFDGTLTKGDTLSRFLWFSLPVHQLFIGCILLSFKYLNLILSNSWSNQKAKETLMATFFKGKSRTDLEAAGFEFFQKKIPELLREASIQTLREHRVSGSVVVVVSASLSLWLRPFCEAENVSLLCTEPGFESEMFSGRFATPNCNGAEKVRRIREVYDLGAFDKIIAYGNSAGDAEMLALADEAWMIRGLSHTFAAQIYKTVP